jgi:CRP-like cAMP-binding protein
MYTLPIFENLGELDFEQILSTSFEKSFRRSEAIYKQGNTVDGLYILKSGKVKINKLTDDGKEVIKEICSPTAIFGFDALMGKTHWEENALPLHDSVETLFTPIEIVRRLQKQSVEFNRNILKIFGKQLLSTEKRLESMILEDARSRIINFIKGLANKHGTQVGFETLVKHHMTQQDIANMTGTSRQTVTSILNDLKNANLIYFNRKSILIRDLNKLY